MSAPLPRVHIVTDDRIAGRRDLAARARKIASAGRVALHARARLDGRPFLALAETLKHAGGVLFVNDRADVAYIVEADGLHLPAQGLPLAAARRLVGARWIGRSAHSPEDARTAADEGADYVFLGPIWATSSHPERIPLGPDAISTAQPARVIALGGITTERVPACRDAGAYGVAVVSAAWDAEEPGSAVREILLSLE